MLYITFKKPGRDSLRILCLGAHSDDIEIGCGGTILRLIDEYPRLEVFWVVFSARGQRAIEAQNSAEQFLAAIDHKTILINQFRDGYFPYIGEHIKDDFEELKAAFAPDLIFTHFRDDLHQDHRLINELTWNTWRDHMILEYEVPKYDGDFGVPNFYITLDEHIQTRKVGLLMKFFQTQSNKHWFTPETFQAILRLRGIECKAPGGYAEAFYCRKVSI